MKAKPPGASRLLLSRNIPGDWSAKRGIAVDHRKADLGVRDLALDVPCHEVLPHQLYAVDPLTGKRIRRIVPKLGIRDALTASFRAMVSAFRGVHGLRFFAVG